MNRIGMSLLLCVAHAAVAAGADDPDPRNDPLAIVVRIHSFTSLPPWEFQPALDQTTRALQAAGIRVEWRAGHDPSRSAREFTVLLLSAKMTAEKCAADQIASNVLGTAAPEAARAWIFVERVRTVAGRLWLMTPDILGQVMTHEVGHLLLGKAPDDDAVMREQVLSTGAGYFRFTREQAAKIRTRLTKAEELFARRSPP